MTKTPGQQAYEADVAHEPRYHDGTSRKSWVELGDIARWSWERNPTPRHSINEIAGRSMLRAVGATDD